MTTYALEELTPPSFTTNGGGMTATRKLRLSDTSQLSALLNELMGTADVAGPGISRTGPATFPGKSWLILDTVSVDPTTANTPTTITDPMTEVADSYNGYDLTLNYKTVQYNISGTSGPDDPDNPGTYLTHRIQSDVNVITIPRDALEWEFDGESVTLDDGTALAGKEVHPDVKAYQYLTNLKHELIWHRVPVPPWLAILNALGHVNSTPFLYGDPHAVLLEDFSAERQFSVGGEIKWELTFVFNQRLPWALAARPATLGGLFDSADLTWNDFLRPNPNTVNAWPQWQRLKFKSNGEFLLPEYDFNSIFHV